MPSSIISFPSSNVKSSCGGIKSHVFPSERLVNKRWKPSFSISLYSSEERAGVQGVEPPANKRRQQEIIELIRSLIDKQEGNKRPKGYKENTIRFLIREAVKVAEWLGYNYFLTVSPRTQAEKAVKRIKEWFRRRGLLSPIGIKGVNHYHLLIYLPEEKELEFQSYLDKQSEKYYNGFPWVYNIKVIKFWKFGNYFCKHLEELKKANKRLKVDEVIIAPKEVKKVVCDATLRGALKELLGIKGWVSLQEARREYRKNVGRWNIVRALVVKILLKEGWSYPQVISKLRHVQLIYNSILPHEVRKNEGIGYSGFFYSLLKGG